MKRIVVILMILACAGMAWAEVKLTGRILNNANRQPVEYANVFLTHTGESAAVSGSITDEDGRFSFNAPAGTYTLHATLIGFAEATKQVTVLSSATTQDLGRLLLTEDATQLQEVEVVGQGTTMRFELDRKVFSVDQQIATSGGSATDVLQNIPSVDVDNEGNISLRNSDAVEIWINGKPSGLTADNRAQILQQLPAESIKEIELITNPSAKYNPEGTAGVINIVMKKTARPGYYGSVQAGLQYSDGAQSPGYNVDANINYTRSFVSSYLNLGYHRHTMSGSSSSDRHNFLDGDTTRLWNDGSSNRSFGGMFLRAGVDFTLGKHTFGVNGFGMLGDKSTNSADKDYEQSHWNGSDWDLTRRYTRSEDNNGGRPGYNLGAYYKIDFSKSQNLELNATYNSFNMRQHSIYTQTNTLDTLLYENGQKQDMTEKNGRWELKADYTNKLTKDSRLELGWQTTLDNRQQTSSAFDYLQDGTLGDPLYLFYNDFTCHEQTHALYVTYGNRFWDRFSVQVGLRGEYMIRQSDTKDWDAKDEEHGLQSTKSYWQLFPSAYLSYSFKNGHELQLNYTRRVDRPRGHQINPWKNLSDSTNIQYGNPDLLPQFTNSLELNYLKTWEKNTLSAGVFYHYTDQTRQNVRYLSAQNVMYSTYVNISRQQDLGVELVDKLRIGSWLQLTASVNGYWSKLNADDRDILVTNEQGTQDTVSIRITGQEDFSWTARLNASFLFTKTFSGQLMGRYRSPSLVAQGHKDGSYTIDLGLRKTFFDRQLAIALNVRDLLNSNNRRNTTWSDNFWQQSMNRWDSRSYSLTVTWSFGNMKKKPSTGQQDQGGSLDNSDYYNTAE